MRLRGRPRSIRLRLALLLTALFVLLGGTLLAVSYALVRSNLSHERQHEAAADRLQRSATELHQAIPSGQVLEQFRAAQDDLRDDVLRDLTLQYLAIMAAMAVLSGALGWFVAGRLLRPVSEITATARRVSKESLHERIALEGPDDELKQLADTFDEMLGRLEAGFDRERAFVRNASHELRTPLSVIRAEADVTLADEANDPAALRQALAVVREAGQRSERLVDALLTLERADRDDQQHIAVELDQLARESIPDVDDLRLELDLRPVHLIGDRELLRTMVANLIDNAVRHNSADGWIEVRTHSAGEKAVIELANSGPTVTAEEAALLTEPFRRLSPARTGDGLGLGLSIAASVARAHGGHLTIDPLGGGGLRVSVALPASVLSGEVVQGTL